MRCRRSKRPGGRSTGTVSASRSRSTAGSTPERASGAWRPGRPCSRPPPRSSRPRIRRAPRLAWRPSRGGEPMAESVLVVDDDPDVARFVEVNLRSAGYDVEVASNGEEALEKAVELRPDL